MGIYKWYRHNCVLTILVVNSDYINVSVQLVQWTWKLAFFTKWISSKIVYYVPSDFSKVLHVHICWSISIAYWRYIYKLQKAESVMFLLVNMFICTFKMVYLVRRNLHTTKVHSGCHSVRLINTICISIINIDNWYMNDML